MRRVFLIFPYVMLTALFFISQTYRFRPLAEVPEERKDTLNRLAEKALARLEVPVGAVLLYRDSIIGAGFNTVVRDSMLSGHAEINAINNAYQNCGSGWKAMNRAEMTLCCTYEPCEMCMGALAHFGIRHVVFEGPKPVMDQVKSKLRGWQLEWQKRRMDAPEMQENLFRRHPAYQPAD